MRSGQVKWWRKGLWRKRNHLLTKEAAHLEGTPPESGGRRFTSHAEMHALCRSIDYFLPETSGRIIQFIGVKGKEGVSSVVRELAATAAQVQQRRVLILDAAHHNPSQHVHFSVDSGYGWMEAWKEKEPLIKGCYPLDEHSLFLSPISSGSSLPSWCSDERSSIAFFQELKETFDLVLIDSAPALVSADSLTTCRFCDGVVLVLEAEKHWRLAETARKRIVENGGSLLGVVFNKRTLYIPEFVYRLLY